MIKPSGLSIFGCLDESSCWVNPVGMGYDAGDFWPWSWRRLKGPGVFLRSTVTNGLVVGGLVSKRSFSTQKIIKKSSVRPSPRKLKLIFATFAWLNLEEDDLTEASMYSCIWDTYFPWGTSDCRVVLKYVRQRMWSLGCLRVWVWGLRVELK